VERNIDCPLVWEILVHRADAHSGYFRDAVRRHGRNAFAFEDPHDRVEYSFHGIARSALLGLTTP
jgi:hypothetical protein